MRVTDKKFPPELPITHIGPSFMSKHLYFDNYMRSSLPSWTQGMLNYPSVPVHYYRSS